MWLFKKKSRPEEKGPFCVYLACTKCPWAARYPVSRPRVCADCGNALREVCGRWVYKGQSEWSCGPHETIRFEEWEG